MFLFFEMNLTSDRKDDRVTKDKTPSLRLQPLMNSMLWFKDAASLLAVTHTLTALLTCTVTRVLHNYLYTGIQLKTLRLKHVWIQLPSAMNPICYKLITCNNAYVCFCVCAGTDRKDRRRSTRRFCFVARPDSSNKNKITQTS